MFASAFVRLSSVICCRTALVLLMAGAGLMPSAAVAAEPGSQGRWFAALVNTYNNKSFCIPATLQLLDVAKAVQRDLEAQQKSDQVTAPQAVQILSKLYPCRDTVAAATTTASAVANPAAAGPEAYSITDMEQTIALIRTLGKTKAHENDGVIDQIRQHADLYPPPVFFSLAQLLYRRGEVDDAIFWFNAARLRADYDALRSSNLPAARNGVIAMVRNLPIELRKAQFNDPQKLRTIVAKVIDLDETTPHHYDARWIDFHGVAAASSGAANGGQPVATVTLPPERWDEIARQLREQYRRDLEQSIAMMSNAKK